MNFLNHSKSYYLQRSKSISQEEKKWEIEKDNIERENTIKQEYKKLTNKNPFKLTTSKKALWLLFILCVIVVIFAGWATVQSFSIALMIGISPDMTPLVAMIGGVLGVVADVLAYYAKSVKENTTGGIIYESAAASGFQQDQESFKAGAAPDNIDDEQGVG